MLYHISDIHNLKTLVPKVSTHGKAYVYAIDNIVTGLLFGYKNSKTTEIYTYVSRLDVFLENPAALNLYEKNGYKKAGEVTFDIKPEGHQLYFCYDKLLWDRRSI